MNETEPITKWDARAYLEQYYAPGPIPDDSVAQLDFLSRHLTGRSYASALDFGSGPCLGTQFVAQQAYGRITLADYSAESRRELLDWVEDKPGAFDWSHYARYALEIAGKPATDEGVRALGAQLRSKIVRIVPCDIRQEPPIETAGPFDLVMSFYCLECIGSTLAVWRRHLRRLAGLLAPGGRMIVAGLYEATEYRVFDVRFPATWLDEATLREALESLPGIDPASVSVEAHRAPWGEQGFFGILLAMADTQRAYTV